MLSDLIEGVPPSFVLNWAEGYFFWAAFVWIGHSWWQAVTAAVLGSDTVKVSVTKVAQDPRYFVA